MNVLSADKMTDDATVLGLLAGGQEGDEHGDEEVAEGEESTTTEEEEESGEEESERGEDETPTSSEAQRVYDSVVRLGQDPEYAKLEIPRLVKAIANAHGISEAELVGLSKPESPSEGDDDWDVPSLKREVARLNDAIKGIQAKEARTSAIDAVHPKLKKEFQEKFGFVITRGMLADAISKNPGISPRQAVFAEYGEKMVTSARGEKPSLGKKPNRDASAPAMVNPKSLSLVSILGGK